MRPRGLLVLLVVAAALGPAAPARAPAARPALPSGARPASAAPAPPPVHPASGAAGCAPPAGARLARAGHGLAPGQAARLDGQLWHRLRHRYGSAGPYAPESRYRRARRIVVPVRFHMVTSGRRGRVSRAAVRRQIATLNAAYGGRFGGADTGVSFTLLGIRRVDNDRWFRWPHDYERPMLKALRTGGPGTLNLVTAGVGADLLGFSTFPQWYHRGPDRDGVVVDYRSLPGGGFRRFHRGFTAVHEIGHWLGLFHTFENGCRHPGDHVGDTPYESVPTQGCPAKKDTCARPGGDPVHNFMNYSPDACMREFTRGQGERIHAAWAAYRTRRGARERAAAYGR